VSEIRACEFSIATQYDGWPNGPEIFHTDGRLFHRRCQHEVHHGLMGSRERWRRWSPYLCRAPIWSASRPLNDLFPLASPTTASLLHGPWALTGLQTIRPWRLFRVPPREMRIDCNRRQPQHPEPRRPSSRRPIWDENHHVFLLR